MKSTNKNKPLTSQLLVAGLVLGAAGCKAESSTKPAKPVVVAAAPASTGFPVEKNLPAQAAPTANKPEGKPAAPAPPLVIGMEDPFKLMNSEGAKTLDAAWKAAKKRQPFEAREAFHEVVTAYPDKPAARFAELRMAVQEGDLAAVPGLWQELLARDYVGYAHRLDAGKEMAPLRKSSHWQAISDIKAKTKAAFTAKLGEGFFFVARIHPYAGPVFAPGETTTKLVLDQEAYHFDPESNRVRRMSDTGGRVLAIHHDGERRQMLVLLAGGLKKGEGRPLYSEPQAMLLSLDTLERTGPVAMNGEGSNIDLCFTEKGEPLFAFGPPEGVGLGVTFDATGASLVKSNASCGDTVATTRVTPVGVHHVRPDPEGVALSDDGLQVVGVDEDMPVRNSSAIRPGSLSWSPGKKRFAYTGTADRCQLHDLLSSPIKPEPNALFVWDPEKKRAARVASAPASYEAQWLDDDRLAYEARLDHATKLIIHDFAGGPTTTIKTPAGAALFGLPTVSCDGAELHAFAQ